MANKNKKMSCVCVLECDPHDIGIAVSYCFVLHFFAPNDKFVFLACLLLSAIYTCLMRPPIRLKPVAGY